MHRVLPAIGLYFLAPLVAEFLLGNLVITSPVSILVFLAVSLLYGGGALLIREVARRAGYGWPTILAFALAYGALEEGITTQSLFNPNYDHYHLLMYGSIPALGISLPWTLFVLGLHMIWSISVPIAIVESLAGTRRTTPWLGKIGLSVTAILYVLGLLVSFFGTLSTNHFVASAPQFVGTGIAAIVIVGVGILLGRREAPSRSQTAGKAPSPWLVGVVSLIAGSLFLLIYAADPTGLSPWLAGLHLSPWLATVLYLLLYVGIAALVSYWSHRSGWSEAHRLALAGGALLAYAWHSFPWKPFLSVSPMLDLVSKIILAVGAVTLLVIAALRLQKEERTGRIDYDTRSVHV